MHCTRVARLRVPLGNFPTGRGAPYCAGSYRPAAPGRLRRNISSQRIIFVCADVRFGGRTPHAYRLSLHALRTLSLPRPRSRFVRRVHEELPAPYGLERDDSSFEDRTDRNDEGLVPHGGTCARGLEPQSRAAASGPQFQLQEAQARSTRISPFSTLTGYVGSFKSALKAHTPVPV